MVKKIHLTLAPNWKDHKMRLGLVFRPYLKMSMAKLDISFELEGKALLFRESNLMIVSMGSY